MQTTTHKRVELHGERFETVKASDPWTWIVGDRVVLLAFKKGTSGFEMMPAGRECLRGGPDDVFIPHERETRVRPLSLRDGIAFGPHVLPYSWCRRPVITCALGRAAMARRQRWLAWLAVVAKARGSGTYERALRGGPPEAFLTERPAWLDLVTVAEALGLDWLLLPANRSRFALALLASPEWAALPWQREAGR